MCSALRVGFTSDALTGAYLYAARIAYVFLSLKQYSLDKKQS